MPTPFRFLPFEVQDGRAAMLQDRAYCDMFDGAKKNKPLLRFYRWIEPSVSYGRTQGIKKSVAENYFARGWKVVQRPTGGGLVEHNGDLCFTIIWPRECVVLPWPVKKSYACIHDWIKNSLDACGLKDLTLAQECQVKVEKNDWCFQSAVCEDVLQQDRKLVGGAQWRNRNVALHQGSLQWACREDQIGIFKCKFARQFDIIWV